MKISLAIMTFSGYERDELRGVGEAWQRVDRLLTSIYKNSQNVPDDIVVCDDWSENHAGQSLVMSTATKFGLDYLKCDSWGGSSKNYNLGMESTKGDWVILAADDEICLKGSLDYFTHFLRENESLPLGMVGPTFIYAYRLHMHGLISNIRDFYAREDLYRLDPKLVYEINEVEPYVKTPYFHGRPPGAGGGMFAVRRDVWNEMGRFYEKIFQPDEDYEVYVWEKTPYWCVHVPTPPVLHYGGGTCWGPNTSNDIYKNCERNWESRPHGDGRSWQRRGEALENRISLLRNQRIEQDILQRSNFLAL